MNATFALANNFKGIIDVLGIFADTATFYFDEQKITIQTHDYSNICMLSIELYSDQFSHYIVKKSGYFSFNLKSMRPILKSMTDTDILHVVYDNILKVIITNDQRQNEYDINLMEIDDDLRNLDVDMDHNVIITTNKTVLNRVLNDIKHVDSDIVRFDIDKENNLSIISKSDDCSLKIHTKSIMTINQSDDDISISFSNKYLQYIQKMIPICVERHMIKMDEQLPFVFVSKIRSSLEGDTSSQMVFYLAPKIMDE